MTSRLRNLLIAGVVICSFARYITLPLAPYDVRTHHPEWFCGHRIIDVTLSVSEADNAQPIPGAKVTVFDHPPTGMYRVALDAAAYDVETFAADADGSCRFKRTFPVFSWWLCESKDNGKLPHTWAKVSAPGRTPNIVQLGDVLYVPTKYHPSHEKPLAVSVVLVKGD